MASKKHEVAVGLGDVANFTTMAEAMEPECFMAMLCEYLDEMSKIIMSKRGIVGEFIGDAIMAWWNVPLDERYITKVFTCKFSKWTYILS